MARKNGIFGEPGGKAVSEGAAGNSITRRGGDTFNSTVQNWYEGPRDNFAFPGDGGSIPLGQRVARSPWEGPALPITKKGK